MIDWERVATLRAEIGSVDFDEVVAMFLSESDEAVVRLRAGRPDPTLEAELHFLKGSALNLGFTRLAELCSQGEKLAAAGKPVSLAMVTKSYDETLRAFKAGSGRDRAA